MVTRPQLCSYQLKGTIPSMTCREVLILSCGGDSWEGKKLVNRGVAVLWQCCGSAVASAGGE